MHAAISLSRRGLYLVQNLLEYAFAYGSEHINYMAHSSGAVIGALCGLVYCFSHRDFVSRLVRDD